MRNDAPMTEQRMAATRARWQKTITDREGYTPELPMDNGPLILEQLPPPTPNDDDHPAYRRRIRAVFYDAKAGRLPVERVNLHPGGGHSTSDPNAYVMGAFRRLGLAWAIEQSQGMATYLLATTADRLGIEAVADWWEGRER